MGKSDTYGQSRTGRLYPNGQKSIVFSMSPFTHSFTILKSSGKVGIQHLPMLLKGIWREKLAVSIFSIYLLCHLSWIGGAKIKKSPVTIVSFEQNAEETAWVQTLSESSESLKGQD